MMSEIDNVDEELGVVAERDCKKYVLPEGIVVRISRVCDGDTIKIIYKTACGQFCTASVRLRSINTPEMRSKNPEERILAIHAKNQLTHYVQQIPGQLCVLRRTGTDSFNRVLADVYPKNSIESGLSLNSMMLQHSEFCQPYCKKKKHVYKWTNKEDVDLNFV